MESKQEIDQHRNIRMPAKIAAELVANSPLRILPLRQLMGIAHYLS
jgi:hypothetical protein